MQHTVIYIYYIHQNTPHHFNKCNRHRRPLETQPSRSMNHPRNFCKTTQNITECNATSAQHVSTVYRNLVWNSMETESNLFRTSFWNSWPSQGSQLDPRGIPLLCLITYERLSEEKSGLNSSENESRLNLQEKMEKGTILHLKNLIKQNFANFLNQCRHSPGACTAVTTDIGRVGVQVTSNAVMFVSGSPTRQRYFHVLSFSILFSFPVWARRDYIIKGEQCEG